MSYNSDNITYIPPQLPNYLSTLYELKPITSLPSDEEVKEIHAVIRAASNASHIPGMHDPDLSMHLGQHLFNLQMAKYRSRYPCNIFPGDNVYTPPELPASFLIKLKPIVGAPSDEEIKPVRSVVRSYEHLANIPEMFDADVEMNLSQHLFDIQMALYVENSMRQQLISKNRWSQSGGGDFPQPATRPVSEHVDRTPASVERLENLEDTPRPADRDAGTDPNNSGATNYGGCTNQDKCAEVIKGLKAGQEESNRQLEKLRDVLENMNRVLIATQRSLTQASSAHFRILEKSYRPNAPGHYLINEKGELPKAVGLPDLSWEKVNQETEQWGYARLDDQDLVKYLRFYNIGHHLISTGDELGIVSGRRDEAHQLLRGYNHDCGT